MLVWPFLASTSIYFKNFSEKRKYPASSSQNCTRSTASVRLSQQLPLLLLTTMYFPGSMPTPMSPHRIMRQASIRRFALYHGVICQRRDDDTTCFASLHSRGHSSRACSNRKKDRPYDVHVEKLMKTGNLKHQYPHGPLADHRMLFLSRLQDRRNHMQVRLSPVESCPKPAARHR